MNRDQTNELELLKKWAWLKREVIKEAKDKITQDIRYSLLKNGNNFEFYIAKIIIYSLFYDLKVTDFLLEKPTEWVDPENKSDFYSISNGSIIFNSGIKDFNNCPYYIIFSESRKKEHPWQLTEIKTCTNHIKSCKCITTLLEEEKQDQIEEKKNLIFPGNNLDYDHILKNDENVLRLPKEFRDRTDRDKKLSEIIKNALDYNIKNIKKTIRLYETTIVKNYYIPLDFKDYGGNDYELYACIRSIEGPKKTNIYHIPSIMTFNMVYSQLLEKPKIEHWTYAFCNISHNELTNEIHELRNKNKELEKQINSLKKK